MRIAQQTFLEGRKNHVGNTVNTINISYEHLTGRALANLVCHAQTTPILQYVSSEKIACRKYLRLDETTIHSYHGTNRLDHCMIVLTASYTFTTAENVVCIVRGPERAKSGFLNDCVTPGHGS